MTDFGYQLIARAIVLLTALPVHESAHGLVSYWLGDPTAKSQGRITLNPLKHLDLMGTLSMFLVGFGWAKPVPIDPRYYKRPKLGMALSAFAGPCSNILLAYLSYVLWKVTYYFALFGNISAGVADILLIILSAMVTINVSLAMFNLLPIPPLDGSRIFLIFLPTRIYFAAMKYERYIFGIIVVLLFTGLLDKPLFFLRNGMLTFLNWATGYVDILMLGLAG